MVEKEFLRVHQCPNQVLKVLARSLLGVNRFFVGIEPGLSEVIERRFQFIWPRLPSKRCQIKFVHFDFVRLRIRSETLSSPRWAGQFRLDVRGVQQVKALSETRRLHPLAFANAFTLRPTKDPQKWR